jgi:hypothetical protein
VVRSNAEINADFVKMKEAAYWIPRTGHTIEQEIKQFDEAASRLIEDFEDELCSMLVRNERDKLIERLEMLRRS